MDLRLVRRDGGCIGVVGADPRDGDQWQAQVTYLLEQAVQRGLVGDGATDERGAVGFVGEAQSVEPGGPAGAEVSLNADLVPGLEIAGRIDRSWFPPSARKLEGDVVSAHHHMW